MPSLPSRPAPAPRGASGVSALLLILLCTLFMMATANATFWGHAWRIFADSPRALLTFTAAIFCLTFAMLLLLANRWLVKPAMILLLLLSAASGWFQNQMGVVIDREMIQNVVNTTPTEASHLLTFPYALHMALFGVLPALVVFFLPLKRERALPKTLRIVGLSALSFALCLGLLLSDYARFAAVFREQKELMSSYQPGAPVEGMVSYAKMMLHAGNGVATPWGLDAKTRPGAKPRLTVFMLGETSRVQNWALAGYARDTNPELAQRDITFFADTTACGTSTAVSVPCLFSGLGEKEYSYSKAVRRENLLDILRRAGQDVIWWDLNTGSQGVAKRVGEDHLGKNPDPALCPTGECTDELLVNRLSALMPTLTRDTVVVLHTIGSHGPSYYLRYPPEGARFTPTCDTGEFARCSADQIVNTYDNTIAWTDHVIALMIDRLAAQDRLDTSLIYASDHGESLGEDGLWLHGAPRFMAPEVQTKVPMLLWLSDDARARLPGAIPCLAQKARLPQSHDAIFPTVLALAGVSTEVADPAQDLTHCTAS